MSGPKNPWRVGAPAAAAYCVFALLALFYGLHLTAELAPFPPFWDAHVYAHALSDWRSGIDPYTSTSENLPGLRLLFVSPPVFLHLMAITSSLFPGHVGVVLYDFLLVATMFAIPAILARYYIQSSWCTAPLCFFFFCFQPNHMGLQALLSGNVSSLLYGLVLLSGVAGLKRRRWLPFYGAIFLAGLLKPMFLALLLLPLLVEDGQWLGCIVTVALTSGGYAAQRFAAPSLFRHFQANIVQQVIVQGDAGFGIFAQFLRHGHHIPLLRRLSPPIDHLLVVGPLVVLLLLLKGRRFAPSVERLWVPCAMVLAILCNPRLQTYDADIALLPALYIVVEVCRQLPPRPWRSLQMGVIFTLLLTLIAFQTETAVCLVLLAAVVLVTWRLARTTGEGMPALEA